MAIASTKFRAPDILSLPQTNGTWLYCPFFSEGQYNQVPFFPSVDARRR